MTSVSVMLVATSYLVNPVYSPLFYARHCLRCCPFKGCRKTCAASMRASFHLTLMIYWKGLTPGDVRPAPNYLCTTHAPPHYLVDSSLDRKNLNLYKFRFV